MIHSIMNMAAHKELRQACSMCDLVFSNPIGGQNGKGEQIGDGGGSVPGIGNGIGS